jgi:hypothetical protein
LSLIHYLAFDQSLKIFAGTGDGAIKITAHGIAGLPSTFTLTDFDDVCELGRGTCSIVRRVRHRASNTDLALKPISIGDKEHRFMIMTISFHLHVLSRHSGRRSFFLCST